MTETKPEWQTHESYGMASFHRLTGHKDNLFGCGVACDTTIRLEIKTGKVKRDLSQKWYFADEHVCTVEFSPAQFVELLTTMNAGGGVPCTFIFANGKVIEPCPKQDDLADEKEHFKGDLGRQISNAFELLQKVQQRILELKISQKAADQIITDLGNVRGAIESNIPFLVTQFEEMMDKKITEGKAEIDAMMTGMIVRLGMDKLKEEVQKRLITDSK